MTKLAEFHDRRAGQPAYHHALASEPYLAALVSVRQAAEQAQQAALTAQHFPMWVVLGPTTSDYPGRYCARLWVLEKEVRRRAASRGLVLADSLPELRALLPPNLIRLDRVPDDDPTILEVWI